MPSASCCGGQGRRASSTLASSTPYAAITTSQVRPVHALLAAAAIKAGEAHAGSVAPEAARTCALAGGIGRGAGRRYRRHAVRARARLRTRSALQRRAPQDVQRIATRSVQRSALRRKNAQPCSARPRGASRLARFGSIALFTVSSDADFTEAPNIDSS